MTSLGHERRWGAVVPTLGNRSSLVASVRSLLEDECVMSAVVVSCQDNHAQVAHWLSIFDDRRLVCLESPRGASRSRNTGLRYLLDQGVDSIALLDDDCTYDDGSLVTATRLLREGALAVSGRLSSPDAPGPRARFPQVQTRITKRNVWRIVMEPGLVLSSEYVRRYGLFEERLGVGCGTPWASGEGTELLLRGIEDGATMVYDPTVSVVETGASSSVYQDDKLAKTRAYARGTGRVYSFHYNYLSQTLLLFRSLAKLAVEGMRRPRSLRCNYHLIVGRVEGMVGRCLR